MTDIFVPKTPHFNIRKPVMVIIHGIGTTLEEAHDILSGNSPYEASAHYLIDQKGNITQYLDETARAYHAGVSYWSGMTDINSLAIGIELEGKPVITDEKDFHLTFYTELQMTSLIKLLHEINQRHRIPSAHILAHQDIAPYRKADPGLNFNWEILAKNNIGLWHDLVKTETDPVVTDSVKLADFKKHLALFGYDPRPYEDKEFYKVIEAFQTHFLPWNICGHVTEQSIQALDILIQKKFSL